jgi:AraC-like DNA-binding protein/rhodanese-related sulfurtransferase
LLGTVLAYPAGPQQRARIIDALRHRADVQFMPSMTALLDALRSSVRQVDTAILPARDTDGSSIERHIRQIAAERPDTAIIVYCRAGSQYSADIRALTSAGAHQFVFAGIDDTGSAFADVLRSARHHCAADSVMRQLAPIIPASLHPIVEAALAEPADVTTIGQLANARGVHRKTLFNWCERAGFLTPGELLTWCRLALVAHYLDTTGCTLETIAIEMAFASDTALRNAIKRYTGMRATDLRLTGGVARVLEALRKRLGPSHPGGDGLHLV